MILKLKERIAEMLRNVNHRRDIALVLSGGGARGWAHIGAIESLEAHGYRIRAIAGTSMGALIGGVYAAGGMAQLKQQALQLTRRQMLHLFNLSPGLDHISNGQGVTDLLQRIVGDVQINDLRIPFCCSASDLVSGKEYVFTEGSLVTAIRASITIPGVFSPVNDGQHIFVDGSVHNTLPLDRVNRNGDDLLVAMNVSAPDTEPQHQMLSAQRSAEKADASFWARIPFMHANLSANHMSLLLRVARLSIQNNTMMALKLTPPDIYAEMPMSSFGLLDFDKAKQIIARGRQQMDKAIEAWQQQEETERHFLQRLGKRITSSR